MGVTRIVGVTKGRRVIRFIDLAILTVWKVDRSLDWTNAGGGGG